MYVKFQDSQALIECTVVPNGNVVTMKFPGSVVVDTSGFQLYLDAGGEYDIGGDDYLGFTTIYRNDEETEKYNGYQLSNDGSTYEPKKPTITFSSGYGGKIEGDTSQKVSDYSELITPVPVPDENYEFMGWEPEIPTSGEITESKTFTAQFVYVQTLEEAREAKVVEMNETQQKTIQDGFNVTLSDGTVEHFTLKDHDQTSLMGLQTRVLAGDEYIPWHTSDEAEHCKFYTNADMGLIVSAAMYHVTYHVTYFRDLRIYIRSMQAKKEVEEVFYGMEIPVEFQSEPLMGMYAEMQEK